MSSINRVVHLPLNYLSVVHHRYRSSFRRLLVRAVCCMLMLCLVVVQTPAATPTVVGAVRMWQADLVFWYTASGWSQSIWNFFTGQDNRPNPEPQEQQTDRDARISRIVISPGALVVGAGEHVQFVAVAYDAQDRQVSGVKFIWRARDAEGSKKAAISQRGLFEARQGGLYEIIATSAKTELSTSVQVRVEPRPTGVEPGATRIISREVSSREIAGEKLEKNTEPDKAPASSEDTGGRKQSDTSSSPKDEPLKLAHARSSKPQPAPASPAMLPLPSDWDINNWNSADNPGNQPGEPPGTPSDDGAGSGNFQFAAPIIELDGRGLDLSLGAAYNSRLWNKAGTEISFDIDKGNPAPGWSLGFGKLTFMGVDGGSMPVQADGMRNSYGGSLTVHTQTYGGATHTHANFTGHTTDSTLLDYTTYFHATNGVWDFGDGTLKYPNGTTVNYGAFGQGSIYPTYIQDANGNYISISYRNNRGPQIDSVIDTLGRALQFHYEGSLLTAITAPTLGGGTRTLMRIQYQPLTLDYAFSGLTARGPERYAQINVIRAIYYPGTNAGYWFGDGDSYSSYGMIRKVIEQRGMSFSGAPLTQQGVISPGTMSEQHDYNYTLTADPALTNSPNYTQLSHTWAGMTTAPAVTTYAIDHNPSGPPQGISSRKTTVTHPDGAMNVQWSYKYDSLPQSNPDKFKDGLVFQDETYTSAVALVRVVNINWEKGASESPRVIRVSTTNSEIGQTTATEFSYGPYNQMMESRDFDYGGVNRLRVTRTEYENGGGYIFKHILNLTKSVEVWNGDATVRQARIEYTYDGGSLAETPGVTMHSDAYNPYAPWWEEPCDCYLEMTPEGYLEMVCHSTCMITAYDHSTWARGLITQIKKYTDAANLGGAVTETLAYDMTGNPISGSGFDGVQTSFAYSPATQYAYSESQTRGVASNPAQRILMKSVYDISTGVVTSTRDADDLLAQSVFDPTTLRLTKTIATTGATSSFDYYDHEGKVIETSRLGGDGTAIAAQTTRYVNGLGELRREEALGPNGADVVETFYDQSGRISKQSRPYRLGQAPSPLPVVENFYDSLGRTVKVRTPDGSESTVSYNQTSSRPNASDGGLGEMILATDEWGRQHWERKDAQGRLVEVVEPDPNGSGSVATNGMRTTYSYDTLGRLIQTVQGAQVRSFAYDSLGRLTRQKMSEASPAFNASGNYVGPNGAGAVWSDLLTYDTRSNLTARADARGVITNYSYNQDPLNRLQAVSYTVPAGSSIPATPSVTFAYMTTGDVMRRQNVTAAGVSREEFFYDDGDNRPTRRRLTMLERADQANYPMDVDYVYDALDRVVDVRYPLQYNRPNPGRKVVHHDYDNASRLTGLQVDGASYASGIAYDPSSQANSINVGNGAQQVLESFTYDTQTGQLANQKVQRGPTALLNLSYDYVRPGTNGGRTGQLTKVRNIIDPNRDCEYEYDALGRLSRATGGKQNNNWRQRYIYDRYGNRKNVFSYTIEKYVRNFYQSILARPARSAEVKIATNALKAAYAEGEAQFLQAMAALAEEMFTSEEYTARNRNDQEFVYDCYKSYLFREPDQGGWDYWTSVTPAYGRANVRNAFANSEEFNLKVSSTSLLTGLTAAAPRDGLEVATFDETSNRINLPGYQYDAAGNQTRAQRADGTWQQLTYDAANRLVKVTDEASGTSTSYVYGPNNQRLYSQSGPSNGYTRNYYIWDGGRVIAEYTETGNSPTPPIYWQQSYIYMGTRLLATLEPNSSSELVRYQHPDHLGTRLQTNSADNSTLEQQTLPFGTVLNSATMAVTSRRFTSYERSATTGLDYAVNRHYDPTQGRFTQVDPIGMGASQLQNPQTLNMYAYCGNDPINHTDPDGLFFGWLKKLFKAIGNALAAIARVVGRILNNKWVSWIMIGITMLVGLPGITNILGKVLTNILQTAVKIYKTAKKVLAIIELAAKVFQGNFRSIMQAIFDSTYLMARVGIPSAVINMIKQAGDVFKRAMNIYDTVRAVQGIIQGGFKALKSALINVGIRFLQALPEKFIEALRSHLIPKGAIGPDDLVGRPNYGTVLWEAINLAIGRSKDIGQSFFAAAIIYSTKSLVKFDYKMVTKNGWNNPLTDYDVYKDARAYGMKFPY